MIRILQAKDVSRVLARRSARLSDAEAVVKPILEAVRKYGDKGLLEYARKFDGLAAKSVRVPPSELAAAAKRLTPQFIDAVEVASNNVRRYAEKQLPKEATYNFGAGHKLGQIVRPLDTVGAYIPAGRYPLPSTLIMTAVPAQVAGVANICVACPKPVDEVYGVAHRLGLSQGFPKGGAQAIAAVRIRDEDRSTRGSHRGSRQYLRRRREETARGGCGDRFRCRPHRDPDHRERCRFALSRCRHAGPGSNT